MEESSWNDSSKSYSYGAGRGRTDPLIKVYLKEAGSIAMLDELEVLSCFKEIEGYLISVKRVMPYFRGVLESLFALNRRLEKDEVIIDDLSHFDEDGSRVKTLDDSEWREEFSSSVSTLKGLSEKKDCLEEVIKTTPKERQRYLRKKRQVQREIAETMKNIKLHPLQTMNFLRKLIEEISGYEAEERSNISVYSANRIKAYLEKTEEKIKTVKQKITKSNLRLVVNIAKKYIDGEVPLMDLIQEGNIGLMRAVNRYDYKKGYHFSTYATWWIKQAVTRAIADQGKTIRIPVHMVEVLKKYRKAHDKLAQINERKPTVGEIAKSMGIPESRVGEVQAYTRKMVSLDMPILNGEKKLEDTIEDTTSESPMQAIESLKLREKMDKLLKTLDTREEKILRMRFGIGDYTEHTLNEIGKSLGVCRERVRQLEKRSLKKLGQPNGKVCCCQSS